MEFDRTVLAGPEPFLESFPLQLPNCSPAVSKEAGWARSDAGGLAGGMRCRQATVGWRMPRPLTVTVTADPRLCAASTSKPLPMHIPSARPDDTQAPQFFAQPVESRPSPDMRASASPLRGSRKTRQGVQTGIPRQPKAHVGSRLL